ncbi:MAG: type II restriction endonuclease [Bacteroidales bacterium]|nr:type II restriction endonuclease [Bacteroidales bacterium]
MLRGRDIKRYGYDWAGLWLIATFPSKKYDIEKLPAIKKHLLSFGKERLEQTGKKYNGFTARKKTNNKWFETQDSISYWDDFNKPKIVYREIGFEMDACKLEAGIVINNKLYMVVGEKLDFLLLFFNSSLFNKIILQSANITGGKGIDFMAKVKCIVPNELQQKRASELITPIFDDKTKDDFINQLYNLSPEEIAFIENNV